MSLVVDAMYQSTQLSSAEADSRTLIEQFLILPSQSQSLSIRKLLSYKPARANAASTIRRGWVRSSPCFYKPEGNTMRTPYHICRASLLLVVLFALPVFLATTAQAQRTAAPGTTQSIEKFHKPPAVMPDRALEPVVTESGFISVSIDGCGTNSPPCDIGVDKPMGATVRSAYLGSASWGGFVIPDGTIALEGTPVNWDATAGPVSGSSLWGHFADVTSIVKPIVDGAPAGLLTLSVDELSNTSSIDGSALYVI